AVSSAVCMAKPAFMLASSPVLRAVPTLRLTAMVCSRPMRALSRTRSASAALLVEAPEIARMASSTISLDSVVDFATGASFWESLPCLYMHYALRCGRCQALGPLSDRPQRNARNAALRSDAHARASNPAHRRSVRAYVG